MNKQVTAILNKQMTRAEFLKYLGIMAMSTIGISSILKNLGVIDKPAKRVTLSSSSKRTFGSGAYGV